MIAVTGSTGQLGSAFTRILPDAICLTRARLDLARPEEIARVLDSVGCDVLINCAAYTAVDQAEADEPLARVVNGESVGEMAAWSASRSVRFVTFSTDYVFDGLKVGPYVESDSTNPQTAYGRSKRLGEEAALEANPDSLIIRTAWLVSGTHPNFISTVLRLSRAGPVRVVDDQRGSPTVADDLARHTLRLLDAAATGLVHAANQGVASWFELARTAGKLAGVDPELFESCSTAEFPRTAQRPANSQLLSERYSTVPPMPVWTESLPAVVEGILRWL